MFKGLGCPVCACLCCRTSWRRLIWSKLDSMRRRNFLASLAAATALQSQSQRRPNILLLIYDKCRADAVGCYTGATQRTPNLNQLATEGIRFDHAYTPQALCAPARASILTGLYPHAHGITRNVYPGPASPSHTNFDKPVIDPFRDTQFRLWDNVVFHLSNAGYATGCIGKWHLGPANPGFFDTFKGFNSLLRHWVGEPHRSPYRPDIETDEGIRFIEANANRPWFLYQSYYAPHEPSGPTARMGIEVPGASRCRLPRHDSESRLERRANLRHASPPKPVRGHLSDIYVRSRPDSFKTPRQLRAGYSSAYEEVVRVPLIMRLPKRIGQRRSGGLASVSAALAPTILDVADVSLTRGLPGYDQTPTVHLTSLFRTLSGTDTWTDPVVIENIPQAAIDGSFFEERTIRTVRHKLILRKFDKDPVFREGELYNLESDPAESVNLYSKDPGRSSAALSSQLESWAKRPQDSLGIELAHYVHTRR